VPCLHNLRFDFNLASFVSFGFHCFVFSTIHVVSFLCLNIFVSPLGINHNMKEVRCILDVIVLF
jgi:hypothetical protein